MYRTFSYDSLFHPYRRLTCKSLVWHSGMFGCERASRHAVHRLNYLRDIPWRKKSHNMAFRHGSNPLKLFIKSEQLLSHMKPLNMAPALYKEIVRIVKQVIFQLYTKTRMNPIILDSGLFFLEPV